VPSDYSDEDLEPRASRLWALAVPLAVLIVVVAMICALVLGGVLRGDRVRTGPDAAPTTLSTVEINP
jgi:hypothetical protein